MALDLVNGYQRKDSASASNVYYGYTPNPNASDTDKVFAIRRVNTAAGVETVTWTNGDAISYSDSWSGRTYSFAAPGGSLGLTCTSVTSSNGAYIGTFTWSTLNGVSKYIISVTNSTGLIDEFGNRMSGPNARTWTSYVFNQTSWTQNFGLTGSHTFTLTATNVAGSTSSRVAITVR
jgi:hypothetical protein